MEYPLGGEALSRAEPPARPPKLTKSLGDITFPKIRENSKSHETSFLGVMRKPFRQEESFSNAYTDTTNTFLDSSSLDLGQKIAPEPIELTDFEISSFF